jgi:hypothetical protein
MTRGSLFLRPYWEDPSTPAAKIKALSEKFKVLAKNNASKFIGAVAKVGRCRFTLSNPY